MAEAIRARLFHKWSADDLSALHKYKYTSPSSTILDEFLNTYWWTPLAEFVPTWVHPNTLTVIALFCSFGIAYWPQQVLSPNSDRVLPRLVYLLSALGYFAYQSLDAVDGKQARRTKLSSPLGQMMDHGCDALTTYYSCFLIASVLQVPLTNGVAIAVLLTCITFQLIYYGWYELRHGVFKTNTGGIGVTEGQYAIIALHLVAFLAPSLYGSRLSGVFGETTILGRITDFLTLRMNISQMIFWPCVITMAALNGLEAQYLVKIVQAGGKPPATKAPAADAPPASWKKNVELSHTVRDLLGLGFHLYVQAALCLSLVLARHPVPMVTAICFFGAQMVWRVMVASLLDTPLVMYDIANTPYYVLALILATNSFANTWFEGILSWAIGLYAIAESLAYAWHHFEQMKVFLDFPLFVVPEANQRGVAVIAASPAVVQTPAAVDNGESTVSPPAPDPSSPESDPATLKRREPTAKTTSDQP